MTVNIGIESKIYDYAEIKWNKSEYNGIESNEKCQFIPSLMAHKLKVQ